MKGSSSRSARIAEYNSEPARAARIRAERDRRLDATTWLVERHKEQTAGNIETSITGEDYAALLAYRQALRDLPQQEGFPWEGPRRSGVPVAYRTGEGMSYLSPLKLRRVTPEARQA